MKKKEKLCLVLEGGGVKCSYQAGVLSVLNEFRYEYDAIGGTSFGALNAALYLGGGMDRVNEFWDNLDAKAIFGDENVNLLMDDFYFKRDIVNSRNAKLVLGNLTDTKFYSKLSDMFHDFVINSVDEEKVRKSNKDFGLVTLAIPKLSKKLLDATMLLFNPVEAFFKIVQTNESDNKLIAGLDLKPLELVNEDIPSGHLAEFVAASSAISAFKPILIEDTYYTDGGPYDNQPVNMMARRGYDKYLLIRTNTYDITGHYSNNLDVKVITPSRELGSCALFSSYNVKDLRELGMSDAIKFLDQENGNLFSYLIKRQEVIKKYNIKNV